jgi:hypothetical protein
MRAYPIFASKPGPKDDQAPGISRMGHWLAVILLVLTQFTVIPIMAMMVADLSAGQDDKALGSSDVLWKWLLRRSWPIASQVQMAQVTAVRGLADIICEWPNRRE